MIIIDGYRSLLKATTLDISDSDKVLLPSGKPAKIDDRELVIPSREWLKKNEWKEVYPYHPLCEDPLMGMSPTMQFTNLAIRNALSIKFSALIRDILMVIVDKDLQKQVKDASANEIMAVFAEAKKTSLASWSAVSKTFNKNQYFANVIINRNVVVDDKVVLRKGTVRVPILDNEDESTLLGVSIPKVHVAGIQALTHKLLEGVETNFESNAPRPYFDVLLQFFKAMAGRYNEILTMFGDVIDSGFIDLDWLEHFEDQERVAKMIPKLPGNAGVRIADGKRGTGNDTDSEINPMENLVVPGTSARDEEDRPPWEESRRPQDRSPKSGGASISDMLRGDDRDDRGRRDDRESRRGDRRRNDRGGRGRDSGRGRDRYERDDRGRGRDSRRRDDRSRGFSIHDM